MAEIGSDSDGTPVSACVLHQFNILSPYFRVTGDQVFWIGHFGQFEGCKTRLTWLSKPRAKQTFLYTLGQVYI